MYVVQIGQVQTRGNPKNEFNLNKDLLNIPGKPPWSSGECRGLRIWAIVLGREFEFWVHLKTRCKYEPLDGRKTKETIKASHAKKTFINLFDGA